jgi:hypothetical protein
MMTAENRFATGSAVTVTDGSNGEPIPDSLPAANAASPQSKGVGRGSGGRFARGNKFGRGNPFARQAAALRQRFYDAIPLDDMREVARKLVEQAKGGDPAAMRLFLAYALGQPGEAVDPDRLDQDEYRFFLEQPDAGGLDSLARAPFPHALLLSLREILQQPVRERAILRLLEGCRNPEPLRDALQEAGDTDLLAAAEQQLAEKRQREEEKREREEQEAACQAALARLWKKGELDPADRTILQEAGLGELLEDKALRQAVRQAFEDDGMESLMDLAEHVRDMIGAVKDDAGG